MLSQVSGQESFRSELGEKQHELSELEEKNIDRVYGAMLKKALFRLKRIIKQQKLQRIVNEGGSEWNRMLWHEFEDIKEENDDEIKKRNILPASWRQRLTDRFQREYLQK